ncbi:DNA binding protein, nucleoid-associated [Variovorax sp. SRS16]|uniref:H-NS family nucleoid-associated regulatory protein n=1 Tax=Variovorax sp. SRS16 TaxID=282217 RepID=UPI00131981DC|nr:H-NS family nucleoid-associated regulatory protein [Variovorax sp. SRS16]VTU28342.1 DNA binding protein, nucleoid-associated [Variovorax sp. SRS16]
MTQSYNQIQKKIEALQRQADKLKSKEVHGVVARIKVAISHYGLTAEQLGLGSRSAAAKPAPARSVSTQSAKYGDGLGNSWSGRGPRPHWLRDAINAGRKLEEFLTGGVAAASSGTTKKKVGKKRPSKVLYRDGAGNSWSGRGPRPRWLKDAIAGGKTLEELMR